MHIYGDRQNGYLGSRNVAFNFKVAECEELGLETNNKALLEDVGCFKTLEATAKRRLISFIYISISISRVKRGGNAATRREVKRLASAELWTTSNDEVEGCLIK